MKNLSTPEVQMKGAWSDQQIAGMPMMIFLGLATCVLYAGWNGSLPLGMVGALALMFVLGTLLSELGERIPPIREYLGGGTILAIFGGAALFEYRILPVEAGEVIIRLHFRAFGDSRVPLGLEVVEAERIAAEHEAGALAPGARIRMGIEVDLFNRPIAYWIRTLHPGDLRARMDFNARDAAREVRDKAPEPLEAVRPAPVRAPVQHQRVQAGVASQHFPARARRRVALKNALDVGTQARKHGQICKVQCSKKKKGSLVLCLRHLLRLGHRLGHAAQDMDFFWRQLRAVKQLVQTRHEFFGCSGVQKTNCRQRLFPVRQHPRHLRRVGQRGSGRGAVDGKAAQRLTPFVGNHLNRCAQVE